MATKKEIKSHLDIALKEIGPIIPWFDEDVHEWVFSHSNYPVEYGGQNAEEVIQNYPEYLKEFIKHRLNENLNPLTENKTKGHGGIRKGAGRPKGSVKIQTKRVSLPIDIAAWITHPSAIEEIRKIMHKHRAA